VYTRRGYFVQKEGLLCTRRRGYTVYKKRLYCVQGEEVTLSKRRRGYTVYKKKRLYCVKGEEVTVYNVKRLKLNEMKKIVKDPQCGIPRPTSGYFVTIRGYSVYYR